MELPLRSPLSPLSARSLRSPRPGTPSDALNGQRSSVSLATLAPTSKPKTPSFNEWSAVKLLEQFDTTDLRSASQPWAYVADYMLEVKLGVSVAEEMAAYEERARREAEEVDVGVGAGAGAGAGATKTGADAGPGPGPHDVETGDRKAHRLSRGLSRSDLRRKERRLNWLEKLRDSLQKEESVGWHVVVCGDEEREEVGSVTTEGDVGDAAAREGGTMGRRRALRRLLSRRRDSGV